MASGINPYQAGPSPIERIAGALNLVRNVYGIKADAAALEKAKLEEEARKQALADAKEGIIGKDKILEHGKDYDLGDVQSPGAIGLRYRDGDSVVQKFATPKGKKTEPIGQLEYTKLIGDGFKEVKPGTQGSILVSTIGADGRPKQSALLAPAKKDPNDKATSDQFKAGMYASRMEQAEQVFSALEGDGYNAGGLGASFQKSVVPTRFQSTNLKKQQQAEDNFLNAVLRRESGAAIADSERESGARQYFPQPDDPQEVLDQKAENRRIAIASLKAEAGAALPKIDQMRTQSPLMAAQPAKAPATQQKIVAGQPDPELQARAAAILKSRSATAANAKPKKQVMP